MPIFGLGCVAGAAGIARAADYVRAFPEHKTVLVSVELCSLTWQRKDLSVANVISSGLFGDGSAAVIVSGATRDAYGPEIVASTSSFYRGTEDVMGWDISSDGFNIVLSLEVPNMVRKHLRGDIDAFLSEQGLQRKDISSWIMHTGGRRCLRQRPRRSICRMKLCMCRGIVWRAWGTSHRHRCCWCWKSS
jgi:alkylresorcinol/alkylpyrone synthase